MCASVIQKTCYGVPRYDMHPRSLTRASRVGRYSGTARTIGHNIRVYQARVHDVDGEALLRSTLAASSSG
jgi:hypothetical protein